MGYYELWLSQVWFIKRVDCSLYLTKWTNIEHCQWEVPGIPGSIRLNVTILIENKLCKPVLVVRDDSGTTCQVTMYVL